MKKLYTTTLYFGALLVAASCDTTEEAYYPGPESDIDLKVVETGSIRLAADGKGKTINIESTVYWDASLSETGNNFTVEQSTDRGNGTVTVSGSLNYNDTRREAKLYVTARNINKQIEIDVVQAQLMFSMDKHDDVVMPEEGGEFSLEFNSTIEWNFRITNNTAATQDWVRFNPGGTGYGDWEPINVHVEVQPNYTEQERSLTLALRPVDPEAQELIGSAGDLPASFTITQAAGTRVQDVSAVVGTVDYHECDIMVNYKSVAPVTDVGVLLYESDGSEAGSFSAEKVNGTYPDSGPLTVHLSGLKEGMRYSVVPYVTSMVGLERGNAVEFTTKADIVYNGVSITHYEITPSSRSVTVGVSMQSDIEIIEGGITLYDTAGSVIKTYSEPIAADVYEFVIDSEEILTPKTEYRVEIFAITNVNRAVEGPIAFTTKGLTPEEDDNNPPE